MVTIPFSYDLHIHSCLSPCGDEDMTPYNIVNMAALCGLEIIALTDHNTCRNCPAALEAAKALGLLVLPGMELTTSEEIHVVCLFAELDKALAFSDYVYEHLPPITNDPEIFGTQNIMDAEDHIIGTLDKLLINATDISITEVADLVAAYGGAAFPAHIDKPAYSVLSSLGMFPEDCGFAYAELSSRADEAQLLADHPELQGICFLHDSDSHMLDSFGVDEHFLEIDTLSRHHIIKKLAGK